MKKRVRFTPEQKAQMKTKALAMLEAGQTQQAIAKALKTTVTTLRVLIKDAEYPGKRKAAGAKGKKPAKTAAPKVSLTKKAVVRFTPEQKAKMKTKALAMLEAGNSQKKIAKTLKTTVTTLRTLIKGEDYRRQNKGGSAKAKKPGKTMASKAVPARGSQGPVAQLSAKHARLQAIEQQIVKLLREQAALKKEMKSIYEKVGKVIFKESE